jgi:hypothetical protein
MSWVEQAQEALGRLVLGDGAGCVELLDNLTGAQLAVLEATTAEFRIRVADAWNRSRS